MTKPRAMILIMLLTFLVLRMVGLEAYPLIHPDEGFWTQASRNWVRYGDPAHDGRLHHFLSPAHFVLLSAFFQAVPASLVSARVFAALAGVGCCVVMWGMARIALPRRAWLPVLLFGAGSMAVLCQRQALLEAHQTFWLLLAAWCWCGSHRLGPIGAGLAMGMALLVKSNSVYLLPAFVLAPPAIGIGYPWRALSSFVLAFACLGGGGYLLAWILDPVGFHAAFASELLGRHSESVATLGNFRLGRFGLNPARMAIVLRALVETAPFSTLLSVVGLVILWRRRATASQPERFFALWAIVGMVFHFAQILAVYRYLTTLAPALAFLSAVSLDWLAGEPTKTGYRGRPMLALVILVLALALDSARLGFGIARNGNRNYWETVAFFRDELPHDAQVLAASHLVQCLPQIGFDAYRQVHPFDQTETSLAVIVQQRHIDYIVVDNEWREYNANLRGDLEKHCRPLRSIGEFEVLRVLSPVKTN